MIYSKEYVKEKFPYANCIEINSCSYTTFSIENVDDFLAFMDIVKPSLIFVKESFVDIEDLTIDILFEHRNGLNPNLFNDKEFVQFITPMCQAHNRKLQENLLTEIPANVSVFVLHEGCCVEFTYENNINPNNIELDPENALLDIVHNANEKYNKIQENKRREELAKIKDQEIMLGQLILSDERFLRCTSQPKRKQYIRQLIQSELGDEYALLKNHWIMPNRGLRSDVDWFIEDLWAQREKTTNKTE